MASHRSPNCPQITFEEAALKGRKVYEKEHTHSAPKLAVAEDLGYSGMNGRSLSMIGALRQYNILEGSSEALRITDDAVTYFELENGPERDHALHRMIFNPPFFESLRQQFGESLPSEGTLKHHLIKEGFLPKAAEDVIRVYRENMRLASAVSKLDGMEEKIESAVETSPQPTQPSRSAVTKLSFSFALSRNTKAELLITGDINVEELTMLRDHVDLTIRALSRQQAREEANGREL